jgi:molybdopterin converting factor small subunit
MKIEVRLFSYLCGKVKEKTNRYSFNMEVEEGKTCAGLLTVLDISQDLPIVILVNGLVQNKDYKLQEGDQVSFLPPVEGG